MDIKRGSGLILERNSVDQDIGDVNDNYVFVFAV